MARLPVPGQDSGSWGDILNDFLSVAHSSTGFLQDNSVGAAQLQDGSVTASALASGAITKAIVGLENVDNTSDVDKPISTATKAYVDEKIPDLAQYRVLARTSSGTGRPDTNLAYSVTAAASTLVYRSGGGVVRVGTPVAADDATTKAYVDGRTLEISSGRVPYRSAAGTGLVDTSIGVTANAAEVNTIVRRTNTGAIFTATPTDVSHAATKAYVDDRTTLQGTGLPNGVVAGTVGSKYIDTAATNGAIEWIKTTGTGSSGWQIVYGDTGSRTLQAAEFSPGYTQYVANYSFAIQRVGRMVTIGGYINRDAVLERTTSLLTLPVGFRPIGRNVVGNLLGSSGNVIDRLSLFSDGSVTIRAVPSEGLVIVPSMTFITNDPWPTVLPGVII